MKTRTKWIVYGVLPAALSLTLQGMYFSGNLVLQRLVCPKLPPLSLNAYREFGILENAQNLLLIAIMGVFIAGVFRAQHPRLRIIFGALAVFSSFILLEEIDYGTHWYRYATAENVAGWFLPAASPEFQALLAQSDFTEEPFNLHNRGDVTDIIKTVVEVLMLILFVAAPLAAASIRHPWLQFATPDRFIVVTVVVMVLMRFLTRYLLGLDEVLYQAALDAGTPAREVGSMNSNLSEFRELLTYYAFLLYAVTLVFVNRPPDFSPTD